MLSSNTLYPLIETIANQLYEQNNQNDQEPKSKTKKNKSSISSAEVITAIGILTGVLKVDSVIMNRDQTVEIVLLGTLRRKTELEKMLDKIEDMTFEEVMRALLNKYS